MTQNKETFIIQSTQCTHHSCAQCSYTLFFIVDGSKGSTGKVCDHSRCSRLSNQTFQVRPMLAILISILEKHRCLRMNSLVGTKISEAHGQSYLILTMFIATFKMVYTLGYIDILYIFSRIARAYMIIL